MPAGSEPETKEVRVQQERDGDRPLRWGILSTANISGALLDSGHGGFVAVASRGLDRAQAFAREHGLERAYGSYEELLADPEIDAIYNPLPNSMHVDWSIRALEAGKHVLCEKPMSRRPEDVERAFDVAEREGRVLAEAFMWRHHPQLQRARELVERGEIGTLRLVRAAFSYVETDPDDIRMQGDLDGGGLMDVGCYCVSGVRALAGEPERVSAEQVIGGHGVDVALVATLRFAGDVLGVLDCGIDMVPTAFLEVVGTKGSLFLGDPWHSRSTRIEIRRPGGKEVVEVPPGDPYAAELTDFAAAVRGEREHPFGRADAVGQARAIAALYDAAG
jgi:xylose dehydrogenase (NAD/NADP)